MIEILGGIITILVALLPTLLAAHEEKRKKENAITITLVDRDISELERQLSGDKPVSPGSQTGV